jgi:hypothetical protein
MRQDPTDCAGRLRRLSQLHLWNNKRARFLFHRNESVGSQALDSARARAGDGWANKFVDFERARLGVGVVFCAT